MHLNRIWDSPGDEPQRERILFDRPLTETICLGRVTVQPGEKSHEGLHPDEEEIYVILSGRANLRIGDEFHEVGGGCVAYVPRNAVHQMTCISPEPLVYLYFANWPDTARH